MNKKFLAIGIVLLLALSFWVATVYFGPPDNFVKLPADLIDEPFTSKDGTVRILRVEVEPKSRQEIQVHATIDNLSNEIQSLSFIAESRNLTNTNFFHIDFDSEVYKPGNIRDIQLILNIWPHSYSDLSLSLERAQSVPGNKTPKTTILWEHSATIKYKP